MAKQLIEVEDHVLRFVTIPDEVDPNFAVLESYIAGDPVDQSDVLLALAQLVLQQHTSIPE